MRIQADPDRLTQVLLNLYLNAIHAIGRQGTITVEAKESGSDRVIITVADSGKDRPDQLEAILRLILRRKLTEQAWGWRWYKISSNSMAARLR